MCSTAGSFVFERVFFGGAPLPPPPLPPPLLPLPLLPPPPSAVPFKSRRTVLSITVIVMFAAKGQYCTLFAVRLAS